MPPSPPIYIQYPTNSDLPNTSIIYMAIWEYRSLVDSSQFSALTQFVDFSNWLEQNSR